MGSAPAGRSSSFWRPILRLTREGVLAAMRFGAEVLRADVAYPVSKSVA